MLYGTTIKISNLLMVTLLQLLWYRPKKSWERWVEGVAENDKRPLLTVLVANKGYQASYLTTWRRSKVSVPIRPIRHWLTNSNGPSSAWEVQTYWNVLRVKVTFAYNYPKFVKTQPGWNSTSENLDNSDLARWCPFSITTIVVQAKC